MWNLSLRLTLKVQGGCWRIREIQDCFALPNQHVGYLNDVKNFYFFEIFFILVTVNHRTIRSFHELTCKNEIIEFENENKQLNFLDIAITNIGNNSYGFKIFRKTLIANVQIKPNSKPHIAMGVLKTFLSRAYKVCTKNHLQSEIDVLIDIFTENGHNRNTMTNIVTEYSRNINKPKSNDQNSTKNTKNIRLPWMPILGPKLRK